MLSSTFHVISRKIGLLFLQGILIHINAALLHKHLYRLYRPLNYSSSVADPNPVGSILLFSKIQILSSYLEF